jgi:hypothetical protein
MNKHLILSVGMPRAGTGWLHNITSVLVLDTGGVSAKQIREKYHLGRLLTEVNCNIGTISAHRILPVIAPLLFEPNYVIKLHGGRKPFADLLLSMGLIKGTFIFRDPRDAALSIYEYGQTAQKYDYVNNDFSHILTVEDAITYMKPYIEIARGWLNSPHVLILKYENMFKHFDDILDQLITYLDLDLELNEALKLVEKFRPGVNVVNRRYTHFKKGKVGRHKDIFSNSQLELCEEMFGNFLRDMDYQV